LKASREGHPPDKRMTFKSSLLEMEPAKGFGSVEVWRWAVDL
jgi:hypothetical protein